MTDLDTLRTLANVVQLRADMVGAETSRRRTHLEQAIAILTPAFAAAGDTIIDAHLGIHFSSGTLMQHDAPLDVTVTTGTQAKELATSLETALRTYLEETADEYQD
jgi:hypothetical protein